MSKRSKLEKERDRETEGGSITKNHHAKASPSINIMLKSMTYRDTTYDNLEL